MQQAITITIHQSGGRLIPQITPPASLPLAALCLGKPVDDVLTLLPRIFNLCGTAQDSALRLSLGLPAAPREPLRREVLREHLLKFYITWPDLLGLPPRALPAGWDKPAGLTSTHLFGAVAPTPDTLAHWLDSGAGLASVLGAIRDRFNMGEAATNLRAILPDQAMITTACDNSVAARHAGNPLMRLIARTHGHGPLWHAFACLLDLDAARVGVLPAPQRLADGTGIAPAARGQYAIRASAQNGLITGFDRITPTDHMLAPNGALQQSLSSLPAQKASLAGLVVAILDPCLPVTIKDAQHA